MVTFYLIFLSIVALERLFEVALSRRHVARALERRGKEYGAERFPALSGPVEVLLGVGHDPMVTVRIEIGYCSPQSSSC